MIKRNVIILLTLFIVTGFSGLSKIDASAQTCDRDCLKGFVTKYLDALIAKKTDSLPLDANVKFTENCKQIKVGEGYWKDVNGTVRYRLDIIDVAQSGIGALVVIKGSSSVLLALRLKIANQKITEIETIVTKSSSEGGGVFNPDGFKVAPADSDMTIMPKTELLNTHTEMIATASKYPEAMKKGSGTFNKNGLYFSTGAYRLENGNRMAGPGCTMGSGCEKIGTQGLPTLSGMVYKPVLVDEQAGIALLRLNFGKGSLMSGSGTLDVYEAFKIYNKDTMHCVYAIMNNVPEGTGFGWDYNPVGTMKNPLVSGSEKNGEKILATQKGVVMQLELPFDKIMLDIYDIKGKLISTKSADNIQKGKMMFIPMDMKALPPGHFIVCARCFTGGKRANSLLFPLNTIR
jgi:hypothetical protein